MTKLRNRSFPSTPTSCDQMIIEDLFEKLSYGPYAALYPGTAGSGFIEETAHGQVLSHANDALLILFTKFDLIRKEVMIEMNEITTFYHLDRKFSPHQADSKEKRRYILDLPDERFEGDVVKILEVYNTYGYLHPLNDDGNPHSLFTPQKNVLQVPHPIPGQALNITYQARHPKLLANGDLSQEIMLPDILVEPLVAYIAYKKYTNMATAEATAKAQEHLAMFDRLCNEAEQHDAVQTSTAPTNTRFEKRGFI